MPEEILNGIPRNCKAITPPTADNGTAIKIVNASATFPKAINNNNKIKNKAIGTATINRLEAFSKFLYCPPY